MLDASPSGLVTIGEALARYELAGPKTFRKVVSGRKLWNYDKKELESDPPLGKRVRPRRALTGVRIRRTPSRCTRRANPIPNRPSRSRI